MKHEARRAIHGIVLLFLLSPLVCCCGEDGDGDKGKTDDSTSLTFPSGFLFGTATAGFQVDMGCPTLPSEECDDPNSDWYRYTTSPRTVLSPLTHLSGQDPAVVGPGHWELYETDFDLAAGELFNNALRMSIEWSRIFPRSTEGVEGQEGLRAIANQQAIAHYHAVFDALHERGLRALVTLNHYSLPSWIHDGAGCHPSLSRCSDRGWADPTRIVREIAKYAGFVAEEFGDSVDLWTTLNEPMAQLVPAFLLPQASRSNPPALFLAQQAFKQAFLAMIEAHARMVDAVREHDTADADGDGIAAEIGIVYDVYPVFPVNPERELDRRAAENVDYLWNMAFLNAVTTGEFDPELDGTAVYREDLDNRMDFLGLNYYGKIVVEGIPVPIMAVVSPLTTFNPITIQIDVLYPEGIYEVPSMLQERFGLPVYITENHGYSLVNGDLDSEKRYLVENLSRVSLAIRHGADIRGYFYWTLMDNFEWNHGMDWTCGLYAVDPHDPHKERVPRETVDIYGRISRAGAVPPDLAALYPIPGL